VSSPRLSILPKPVKPARGQLGVFDGVLNVPVAEVVLQGARVLPVIRQLEAAGMPQHVGMHREATPLASPLRASLLRKSAGVLGASRSDWNI
jgi:hypothetical protein